LKAPVAVGDEKVAFTVKLPRGLVRQVRDYARARRLSLSELVSRALRRLLARR
jgi:3,4-dihydroxy-2-butanone 4-phosphate synthase